MILHGNCIDVMKTFESDSIETLISDPPWAIKFMQKKWDYQIPSVDIWKEAYRVLKPGAHILVCCGTRTQHRMVVNIEDAGFEVRDVVTHLYGSGFPKSHNIGNGFGTALKPACEFWTLARKPLEKGLTVAENVAKHGTGAINIDECRIAGEPTSGSGANMCNKVYGTYSDVQVGKPNVINTQGRWPANITLDEVAAEMLDEQSGNIRSRNGYGVKGQTGGGTGNSYVMTKCDPSVSQKVVREDQNGYLGGASRFFYVAKSSKKDRNSNGAVNNVHPTCKPTKLMEYLIKLITPPNGTVLDPFMGSGSTGVAAKRLGFKFIGIEQNLEYCQIAEKRIGAA